MSQILSLTGAPLVHAIGWALIHFLWQGLLIGVLVWIALAMMRRSSADARYAVCLAGMLVMLIAPIITTLLIMKGATFTLSHSAPRLVAFVGSGGSLADRLSVFIPWFTSLWIVGAFSCQIRLILKLVCAERIRRTGLCRASAHLQSDIDVLIGRLGITKTVRLMESKLVTVPSVVGWLNPMVLLPSGITDRLSQTQIRGIIAHELAHIRRNDYLINLVQNFFESLLFFHPMTWWISNRLRIEREFSCDDIALTVSDNHIDYAEALYCLEEMRHRETGLLTASTGGSLMNRIARIFGRRNSPLFGKGVWLAPVLLLVGAVALGVMAGSGCQSEARSGEGMNSVLTGPTTGGVILEGTELREEIVEKLRKAVDRGDLTEEQFNEAVKMVDDNMECLIECPTGATAILCSEGVDPDCCPGGEIEIDCTVGADPDCCPEGIPPECCPDWMRKAASPDCCPNGVMQLDCTGVDIRTVKFDESGECTGVAVCVKKEASW